MLVRKISAGALAALALAACGSTNAGSSGTSGSTGTSGPAGTNTTAAVTTRAEFIAQADALCKTAHARQGAVHGKATPKTTAAELVPLLRAQAKIAKTLSASLDKLTPPTGDRATVGRFEHAVTELNIYSAALANSIQANHAYAAKALALKLSSWRQQETLLGQGYGYKICANGTSY
ncbi:MAG TPA: hypothetical protein VIJ51_01215 [Solirubrobacteraceae bacterium]